MGKYTSLFKNYDNLYADNSPLIICARALTKDSESGKVFAQLKFKNIYYKNIKAVKVAIKTFDTFGAEIEGIPEYQYLDLNAKRNDEFGGKTTIELPNEKTRSFEIKCTEVFFDDGSSQTLEESIEWKVLPKQKTLEEKHGSEIAEQYRRDTFAEARFEPDYHFDIWRCACGGINKRDENRCNVCKHSEKELLNALNRETLAGNLEIYKKEQAEKAEAARLEAMRKAEEAKIEAEKQKKKNKKIVAIVLPILTVIIAAVVVFTTVIQPQNEYNAAVALMEEGKYEEAITAFEAMEGYKDSAEQIINCENGITEQKYQSAVALMEEGKYEEAATAFETINGYKDSKEQIENIKLIKIKESLKNVNIGEYIKFGNYEQDNDKNNGKESVEWLVLDIKDNKALVVSKYAIVYWYYDASYMENVTWETCYLREWLNYSFINVAFTEAEKNFIPEMIVPADDNEKYGTDGGNDTQDRIFILSVSEVKKYLSFDERMYVMTDYVAAEKGYDVTAYGCLRTPGKDQTLVSYIDSSGFGNYNGELPAYLKLLRPAMWIDLSLAE